MSKGVLFITTDAVGGVWTYSAALARGLASEGRSCVVAVLGPPPDAERAADIADIPNCTLMPTGLPLDWTLTGRDQLDHLIAALADMAECAGASAVHLHAPVLAANGWSIPAVSVTHSCMATWWDAVRGGTLPHDMAWHAKATAEGIEASDIVIAPSLTFAEQLGRVYNLSRPVQIVLNGVADIDCASACRKGYVLTAGRLWDDAKNVAVLDRAASILPVKVAAAGPSRAPDGTGPDFVHLEMLGTVSPRALRQAMAAAAIFASPARYEPFGLVVLEAAQSATPLVLSDIPTFRELWSGAALFVAPDDASEWACSLMALLGDDTRREKLGRAAQARAREYTPSRMVSATMQLHSELGVPALHAA